MRNSKTYLHPFQDELVYYPKKNGKECEFCGLSSIAHKHKPGTLPKDYERIEDEPMSNSTQNDKQKVTRADIKVTMTFYPREGTQCGYCGISSFAHRHKAGSLPKDFERLPDASKTLQEDHEHDYVMDILMIMGVMTTATQYGKIDKILTKLRADARKEVIKRIEAMPDKDVRPQITVWLESKEYCLGYNKALSNVLATLREEEKHG